MLATDRSSDPRWSGVPAPERLRRRDLRARRGGRIALRGAIRLNVPPPEGEESFSGVIATDQGVVEFDERQGSSLELGNGACPRATTARFAWAARREHHLRYALRTASRSGTAAGSTCATPRRRSSPPIPRTTPIGLEHDGHVLAEGAQHQDPRQERRGDRAAESEQLTCNDVELDGGSSVRAVGDQRLDVRRLLGDLGRLEASTGATIHVEKLNGTVVGPIEAKSGGVISLPDRVVSSR